MAQCPHQRPAVKPAAATRELQPWREQSNCALDWFPWQWVLLHPCLSAPGKDKDTQEQTVGMRGKRNCGKAPSLKAKATNSPIWVVTILGDLGQAIPWLWTKCQESLSPGKAPEKLKLLQYWSLCLTQRAEPWSFPRSFSS